MPKKTAETLIDKLLAVYNMHSKEATNVKADV